MIAAIGVVLTIGFRQELSRVQMLDRLIELAGPSNGYGDYLQAAKLLGEDYSKIDRRQPLDAARVTVAKWSSVLALIRSGNAKPVSYPEPKPSVYTLQPELVPIRNSAILFTQAASVAFADGDRKRAFDYLHDAWILSEKIEHGTVINALIGSRVRNIVLDALKGKWSTLTFSELQTLAAWSKKSLERPPGLLYAAQMDRVSLKNSYEHFLEDPGEAIDYFKPTPERRKEIIASVQKLPATGRKNSYDQFLARLESDGREVAERLREPESRWLRPLAGKIYAPAEVESHDRVDFGVALFGYLRLLNALGLDFDEPRIMLRTAAVDRIQKRILGLHAVVWQYRLKNGRLPRTMKDAFGREPIEPITGKPYRYVLGSGASDFRIIVQVEDGEAELTRFRLAKS